MGDAQEAVSEKRTVCVSLSALDAGHLTLPERLFVTDADPEKRSTVPSLSFLIQHSSVDPGGQSRKINLVFDLGLKRDLNGYPPVQQAHIAARQPVTSHPDCADSLRYGTAYDHLKDGDNAAALLDPAVDIDVVVLSHVHWDHVGTPADFSTATFVVGSGTLDLLKNGAGPLYPAEIFNDDELPNNHTVELPPVSCDIHDGSNIYQTGPNVPRPTVPPESAYSRLEALLPPGAPDRWSWKPLASFPHALDLFGDGSLYIINSPGHLYGHVNLLARVGDSRYVYLGGDCCHDPRILRGERDIALYDDGQGGVRSVHVHTGVARQTLDQIDSFMKGSKVDGRDVDVEVVVAHDGVWREKNRHRFWPNAW